MAGIIPGHPPTAATIKALYESNANTNALTDALLAKVNATKTVLGAARTTNHGGVGGTTLTTVLTGPTLAANKVYALDACIAFTAGTTNDAILGWTVPSGTTMRWHNDLDNDLAGITESGTLTLNGGGATAMLTFIRGIVQTGGTAGAISLQGAENIDGAADFVCLAGTWFTCTEVG